MENKEEFKIKNVETLPEGWKRARLGEVLKYEQPYKYTVKSTEYRDSNNIPVLTAGKTFILGYTDEKEGIYTDLPVVIFDDFTTESKFVDFPFKVKSSAMKFLKVKNSNFELKFISESMQLIKFTSIGGAHKRRWISEFQYFQIPLPPLPEQKKITEILETVDNVIEKTDAIIGKYKRIKQGLMQDLLTKGIDEKGQIRSEQTHKFKDSPLGRIPEEWEVVKLGEVIEERDERVGNAELEPVAIGVQGVRKRNEIYYKDLSENYSNNKVFKYGFVAFGLGTNEMAIGVNVLNEDFCVSPAYKVFEIKNVDAIFFQYFVNFIKILFGNKFLTVSARQGKSIDFKWFLQENVILPSRPEQQRIAEILSQIDKTIEKEIQYKEKLERLKNGLMEDLFTGKVRVNNLVKEE